MKKTFRFLSVLTLAAGLFLAVGCHKTLEGGGAYAPQATNSAGTVTTSPDMAFYAADSSFWLAYTALDDVFSIERDNRDTLWKLSPAIKHTLDEIRPKAVMVAQSYLRARAAYMANPTPSGLTGLQEIVAKVIQLVSAARAALPGATVLPAATPVPVQ